MRVKGTLVEWNDSRGFGFIELAGGGERAFCHISDFADRSRRPAPGERLTYEVSRDERGRPHASQIRRVEVGGRTQKERSSGPVSPWTAVLVSGVFLAIVVGLAASGRVPWFAPVAYVILSSLTVFAYAFDKSAAMNRRWRTQESTLHLLSLLGGWPGAWISQQLFRHKTQKTSFIVTFLLCTAANIALLAWLVVTGALR